jgi:hypothetical protein
MEDEATTVAPAPKSYKLSLTGDGLSVEREVTEDVALQILAAVMGGAAPAARQHHAGGRASGRHQAPSVPLATVGTTPGRLSLREYLLQVEAKRNVDKILAIAAFLREQRGLETFDSAAIKKEFRNAGEAVPGNFPRDFRWAITAGWIAAADDVPGEYYITTTGDKALEAKFSADVKKASPAGKSRRRRTRKNEDEA